MTPPVAVVAHPAAEALIGGVVYRGSLFASITGRYLFGDYVTGTLWSMPTAPIGAYGVAGHITASPRSGPTPPARSGHHAHRWGVPADQCLTGSGGATRPARNVAA